MALNSTLAYYQANAEKFFSETRRIDMSPLRRRFLERLPAGGHILDAGCGSGRDSKAFAELGYQVAAFDASKPLVELARTHTGLPIAQRSFAEINETARYDGIWACASLLHLPEKELEAALRQLWKALKAGGILYLSFKFGEGEREQSGRHFTDATQARLGRWLRDIPDIETAETWITEDPRADRDERWLNALLRRHAICRGPVDNSHRGSEPTSVTLTLAHRFSDMNQ